MMKKFAANFCFYTAAASFAFGALSLVFSLYCLFTEGRTPAYGDLDFFSTGVIFFALACHLDE